MAVYILAIIFICDSFVTIYASYHWIVTEGGSIQAQLESSAFPLKRQYDLLALLEQEKRVSEANSIYEKLLKYKVSIDNPWQDVESASELETKLYKHDVDCIISGKPLSEHKLLTNFLEYYDSTSIMKQDKQVSDAEPDCVKYSKLDFSMSLFHHLQSLNNRSNLSSLLASEYRYNSDLDLNRMLHKNKTNWVVYNLASWYWRSRGNASKAIECSRRAVFFAPRDKKYIPLLNLGTLLQDLQSLGEAAIVLHAAVDHAPIQPVAHMALGNVYIALGDYNRSLACYENVLRLQPNHEPARVLRHAVLCHRKLEQGLVSIHQTLQSMLEDLQKYHELQERWLVLQNHVNWEKDRKHNLEASPDNPLTVNLHMLLQNVESQAKLLKEELSKKVRNSNVYHKKEASRIERNTVKTETFYDCEKQSCSHYEQQPAKTVHEPIKIEKGWLKTQENTVRIKELEKMEPLLLFFRNLENAESISDLKHKVVTHTKHLKMGSEENSFINSVNECLKKHTNRVNIQNCVLHNFKKRFYNLKYKLHNLLVFTDGEKLMDETPTENYNSDFDWLEFNIEGSDWSKDEYIIKSEL